MKKCKGSPRKIRLARYFAVADAAAKAEQCAQYTEAALLWEKATHLALNRLNQQWATDRSKLCLSFIKNGWGTELPS